jgi:hypothetical protein
MNQTLRIAPMMGGAISVMDLIGRFMLGLLLVNVVGSAGAQRAAAPAAAATAGGSEVGSSATDRCGNDVAPNRADTDASQFVSGDRGGPCGRERGKKKAGRWG